MSAVIVRGSRGGGVCVTQRTRVWCELFSLRNRRPPTHLTHGQSITTFQLVITSSSLWSWTVIERVLNGYLTETVSQDEMRLYAHYWQTLVLLKFLQENASVQIPKALSSTLLCHLPAHLKIFTACFGNLLIILPKQSFHWWCESSSDRKEECEIAKNAERRHWNASFSFQLKDVISKFLNPCYYYCS